MKSASPSTGISTIPWWTGPAPGRETDTLCIRFELPLPDRVP